MYQIDNSSAAPLLPASTAQGTAGFFTDGNPATGTAPTILPAEFLNMLMLEVLEVLSAAGVTPSKSNFTQLATAIRAVNRQAVILADTGTAGAYAAANTPALTALPATGYVQWVNIAHPNPGAATYSPDGLAAKPIYGLGLQALQGGELPAGLACFRYLVQPSVNGGNGAWIVIESLGGASQIAPGTASAHAASVGQLQSGSVSFALDTGTANTYVCAFAPAITARVEGLPLRFKAKTTNNGACTFNDGVGVVPLVGGAHAALQGGEIVANGDCWVNWNSSVGSGSYVLLFCTGAAEQIAPATQSQHAIQLGQANNLFGGNTTFVSAAGSTTLTSANAGLVSIDATAGAITITLPLASAGGTSFQFTRIDTTANAVTISRAGSDLVGGATSLTLSGQYSAVNLRSNGVSAWTFVSGAQRGIARFLASSSWTCPPGITTAYVSGAAGGGGGGGGGTGVPGSGGGAGQSDVRRAVTVVPGTVYTVTIGTAGSGGALNTGGGSGGVTSLGALVSFSGGNGGAANGPGGNGGGGVFSQSGQTCSSTISTVGGQGGSTAFGGGGQGGLGGNTGIPGASNTGAGGGGGAGGGSGNFGAAGGSGLLIVEW